MSSATLPAPSGLQSLQRGALAVGVPASLALVAGLLVSGEQFYRSYLFAYLFWVMVAIGSMGLLMLQHLTGGAWGLVSRRVFEAAARSFPVLAVLFLPVVLGVKSLYVWSHGQAVQFDPVIRHQSVYMNWPFFALRALLYFSVWSALAYFLSTWSRRLDGGDDERLERGLRRLSGGGLVALALTLSLAAVDWAMSLNPHWVSTVYGMLFIVGSLLSAMAFTILVMTLLARERPLSQALRPGQVHDLGKIMLALVLLWAYLNFSQFLIIWSANVSEYTPFYVARLQGGWEWVGLALVLFHFALPFALLLSRDLKRNASHLAFVAGLVFVVRAVDLYWLVGPDMGGGHGAAAPPLHAHWLDPVALLAVGGLWTAAFVWQLRSAPLLARGASIGVEAISAGEHS
jgi:hypothetical protein